MGLTTASLLHVFQYWDAQTDDKQLTEAVMRSAESLGAVARYPAEFLGAAVNDQECHARYHWQGTERTVESSVIVNAAGPWAGAVAALIEPEPPTPAVELGAGDSRRITGGDRTRVLLPGST